MNPHVFVEAVQNSEMETVRELFKEYEKELDIDLCFQNFEEELRSLPGKYASPWGGLYFAWVDGKVAGCVAFRPLEKGICEMKRLYVRQTFRRTGAGRRLAEAVIEESAKAGYEKMRLDTLKRLEAAVSLYQSLGFYKIPPYTPNPSPDVIYMEKSL